MADLEVSRGIAIYANVQLGTNWLIAKDWSESFRLQSSQERLNCGVRNSPILRQGIADVLDRRRFELPYKSENLSLGGT